MVDKSLYGLKPSGDRWHEALVHILMKMKLKSSKIDSDLWMQDCGSYYEYLAVFYVNDLIILSKDPLSIIKESKQLGGYTLKMIGEQETLFSGERG